MLLSTFKETIITGGAVTWGLEDETIGNEGAEIIAQALETGHATPGVGFNLSTNAIGDDGIVAIARALQSGRAPSKLKLDLSRNHFSITGIKALADAISSGLAPDFLTLNLENNSIDEKGIELLFNALSSGSSPQHLRLYLNSGIIINKIASISTMLKSGNAPFGLHLEIDRQYFDHEYLDDECAKSLADAISFGKCPSDLHLSISSKKISVNGIKSIATAISSGFAPPNLSLVLNDDIDDASLTLLAEAISSSKAPKGLALSFSNKTYLWTNKSRNDKGIIDLARAISSGSAPENLSLNIEALELSEREAKELVSAIGSDNAPKNLRIKGLSGANELNNLTDALILGKGPEGLSLIFPFNRLGESQYRDAIESFLNNVVFSVNAPKNLSLELNHIYPVDDFISLLTELLETKNAPMGLNLKIDSEPHMIRDHLIANFITATQSSNVSVTLSFLNFEGIKYPLVEEAIQNLIHPEILQFTIAPPYLIELLKNKQTHESQHDIESTLGENTTIDNREISGLKSPDNIYPHNAVSTFYQTNQEASHKDRFASNNSLFFNISSFFFSCKTDEEKLQVVTNKKMRGDTLLHQVSDSPDSP